MKRLFVALIMCGCFRSETPAPLRIAAASDLTEAFTELATRFEAQTKIKVSLSFGSSGLLAKQIIEGAPFDIFAAANAAFVDDTVKEQVCDGQTIQGYASGRLAAWSASTPLPSLDVLLNEANRRVALANPEHAPYGRAAKEALENAGLWERLKPRLVFSENVRQAFQFAKTGNAEIAFVSYASVINDNHGFTLLVDPKLYSPIEQTLVICHRGKQRATALQFVQYLKTPEARALMESFGFKTRRQSAMPMAPSIPGSNQTSNEDWPNPR